MYPVINLSNSLISTAAQATEYREIKAEEILKQIENDGDVNYTDCRIIEELNVSKIKLETIPNQYTSEDYILDHQPNMNSSVIESNIKIKNCDFWTIIWKL